MAAFVGRGVEVSLIQGLLDGAVVGRGGALVLRGEAGIGKSVLLEHAVDCGAGAACVF